VLALAAGFGWQQWKVYEVNLSESASHDYQALLQELSIGSATPNGDLTKAVNLAEKIKDQYSSTSYAQFTALQLAKLAAQKGDLEEARKQLRWVLAKAPAKSDIADIAQLRLARVLASTGDTNQALEILAKGEGGTYAASYAIAKGDIYMQMARYDDARNAYTLAKTNLLAAGVNGSIATLDQKLQSLNPIPAREVDVAAKIEASTLEAPVPDGHNADEPEATDAQEG